MSLDYHDNDNCDVSNSVGNGPRGEVSLLVSCKFTCQYLL